MCTAILGIEPGRPLLLAGIRDELADRAWRPPGAYWPDRPGVIGGRDLLAGGTWLAVAPAARRAACVLNGRGRMAPTASRRSRGEIPLYAAADGKLPDADLAVFDPFHLLVAEPGRAVLWSWDGDRLAERELGRGLHMVLNSGLAGDLTSAASTADGGGPGRAHELARVGHFLPRLRAAGRPDPEPGAPVADAWGPWLPLLNGDGLGTGDPRALIVRRDLGGGRVWGTTSVSLVGLAPDRVRYDFTGSPGDPEGWYPVSLAVAQARGAREGSP